MIFSIFFCREKTYGCKKDAPFAIKHKHQYINSNFGNRSHFSKCKFCIKIFVEIFQNLCYSSLFRWLSLQIEIDENWFVNFFVKLIMFKQMNNTYFKKLGVTLLYSLSSLKPRPNYGVRNILLLYEFLEKNLPFSTIFADSVIEGKETWGSGSVSGLGFRLVW